MKKLRILFSFLLIFTITTLSFFPFTKDIPTAQAASSIYLKDTNLTLEVDHYKTLRVGGTSAKASWSTSNSNIATVSSSGKIFAKAPGFVTITAKVGGQRIRCKVNVVFMRENIILTKKQSTTLTVLGTKNVVTYTSENPQIAKVSESGKVTAVAIGTTNIIASMNGKDISSKVSVVGINHDNVVLELGGWSGFIKTLKIEGITGNIKWSSANTAIATIGSDGRVRAKGPGTTIVTASIDGKKLTSTIKVIQASTKEFNLRNGKTKKLSILGTNNKVTWDTNNNSIAVVSADGIVTPVSQGSASIYGFVDGRKVTIKVNVIK